MTEPSALQLIIGTAAADHERAIADDVANVLAAHPHARIFYLVPNHVKYEAEIALLKRLRGNNTGVFASDAVQTLSFTRLAWFFLKDSPAYRQPRLDATANTMIVADILASHKQELQVYPSEISKPGFVAQLAQQLGELQMGRITADVLTAVEAGVDTQHQAKIHDLALLLRAYEQQTATYTTNAGLLNVLIADLRERDLSQTYFYLDHFNELAASELQLVQTLIARAAKVTVALTMADGQLTPAQQSLFRPALTLRRRLVAGLPDGKGVATTVAPLRDDLSAGIRQLDQFWQAPGQRATQPAHDNIQVVKATDAYQELRTVARKIQQAVHAGKRYRDFLIIARRLAPYRDIIAPIMQDYQIPYFADREHPMTDHPLVALIDSVCDLFLNGFQYQDVMRFLRTELVRPADLPLADYREAVDITDNHLLRTGISGRRAWFDDKAWRYFNRPPKDEDEAAEQADPEAEKTAQLEAIHQHLRTVLTPLADLLKQPELTGLQLAQGLMNWLVGVGVTERLAEWASAAETRLDPAAAAAGQQAWQTFTGIVDAYAAIAQTSADVAALTASSDAIGETGAAAGGASGKATALLASFQTLLDAGFSGASFTQIPATLDQVTISETALARRAKFDTVFVIGATDAAMPEVPSDTAVLNAADRQALQQGLDALQASDAENTQLQAVFLPETGASKALGDPFINYVAEMAATRNLIMSYPTNGEEANNASPYLLQLAASQGIDVKQGLPVWGELTPATDVAEAAGTARSLLSDWVVIARQAPHTIPRAWETAYHEIAAWLAQAGTQQTADLPVSLPGQLREAIAYQNAVQNLRPETARALYSTELSASISQLQSFYSNPYEYFLTYGLRLQERPEFELTPADYGSFYHAVMDGVMKALADKKMLLTLDDAALKQAIAVQITQIIQDFPVYRIFTDEGFTNSRHMAYLKAHIADMLLREFKVIQFQLASSGFTNWNTEILFAPRGRQPLLPPVTLTTEKGRRVAVRGKIDRLDTKVFDDGTGAARYLVLDYKSSTHDFTPYEAYYGLNLQLLTYLDAVESAVAKGKLPALADSRPGGAFYLMFDQPLIKYADLKDLAPLSEQAQRQTQLLEAAAPQTQKQYRLKGFVVLPDEIADQDDALASYLSNFADDLVPGSASLVVPLALNQNKTIKGATAKDGSRGATIHTFFTQRELARWIQHDRKLITEAADNILDGVITLAPLDINGSGARFIARSPYQAVMRFDAATGADHYNTQPAKNTVQILELLKQESAGKDGDDDGQ
ncbi:PD-(D/E)XK nuclease family protein [Lacticaseibacillus mingshuiensis]|uniref:PD-(D/E)XK nuclease family protein n=1 Tax=Lacticaseibacillus mingshuiensis TaxID=2799574 RepID=UPI001950D17A|nr:PD-(D/E)XK nuclease family protein [Lacticaseibacillus mingshuiensis]